MSQLDSEIESLRNRLASMEEQRRIETENVSNKVNAMKSLQKIVEYNKNVSYGHNNKFQSERWRTAQNKLEFLEPILNILKDIQERLENLEKANPTKPTTA